jgi:hypothetical protein
MFHAQPDRPDDHVLPCQTLGGKAGGVSWGSYRSLIQAALSIAAVWPFVFSAATASHENFSQIDLERLLETGACPGCNLEGAPLKDAD